MSPEELAQRCAQAINGGWKHVQLTVPGHVRGQRVRLDRTSRRKCPIGEHVCDLETSTLAAFDAVEVLAWLVANGAIALAPHPLAHGVPHVEHPPARADGQQHGDDGEDV